jgi:hypothetical protein
LGGTMTFCSSSSEELTKSYLVNNKLTQIIQVSKLRIR